MNADEHMALSAFICVNLRLFILLPAGAGARGRGSRIGRWPSGPVDDAAAFAAKRKIRVAGGDRLFTNRASHHTATKGEILMNAEAAGGRAVSVGGSKVPTKS